MFLLSIVLIFMPLDRGKSRKRKWLPGINFLAVKCDADFAELFLPPMHFRLSHYCCSFISASWWFCFIAKLLPSKIIWLYITKMLLSCFTCSCSTLLPSHARVLLTNNCTIFESETFLLCTLYAYNHPPFLWYDKEIWHFLSAPQQTVNIFAFAN